MPMGSGGAGGRETHGLPFMVSVEAILYMKTILKAVAVLSCLAFGL